MTGPRMYAATLIGLLAGGVLLLVASGLTWGEAGATGRAVAQVDVAGRDVLPAAQAIGLLALAAVVAVHASRRWGRRIVGGVLAVAGAGLAGWALLVALDLPDRVVRYVGGPDRTGGFDAASVHTGGPILAMVGGVLVGAAGVAVALSGPAWPGMRSRYDRAGTPSVRDHRSPPGDADRDAWKALDRGEDPTTR